MKTKPQYEDKSIRQPIQGNTTAGYLMDGPPFKDKNCTQPSNGTSIVQSNWDVGHLPHGHIPLPNIFPTLGQMSVGQKPRQNLPNFLGEKTPRTKPPLYKVSDYFQSINRCICIHVCMHVC